MKTLRVAFIIAVLVGSVVLSVGQAWAMGPFGGGVGPCDPWGGPAGAYWGFEVYRHHLAGDRTSLLAQLDVWNPCVTATHFMIMSASRPTITFEVAAGANVIVGKATLKKSGLWNYPLSSTGNAFYWSGFDPCNYQPNFVIGSDGTLSPPAC
jgi:hypothetical protein